MPPVHSASGHPAPRLRAAGGGDLAALVDLEQRLFAGDRLSRRSFAHFLRSPGAAAIVAETDHGVAGYALVLFRARSPIARLYSIAVAAADGGRGLGSALLKAAEEAALARGASRMRLEVSERNVGAASLYRRRGYAEIGKRQNYYEDGSTALRMEKNLA